MEGKEADEKNKMPPGMNAEAIERMKDEKRKGISALGTFLSVLFLLFVAACVFLIGFQLRATDSRWSSKSPIKGIGIMQIVHVSLAFITSIFAISIFFCCPYKGSLAKVVSNNIYKYLVCDIEYSYSCLCFSSLNFYISCWREKIR